MLNIIIISASIRTGRKSHNVALYLEHFIKLNYTVHVELLDLKHYAFPLFEDRLDCQAKPSLNALEFKNKIIHADGVIIVSPEYNAGIPASLKNVIDLLYDEWQDKTIAFSTVSSGELGGNQALTHLEFVFNKIGADVDATNFPVSVVQDVFDSFGVPTHKKRTDKLAKVFIDEFIKCIKINENDKV